VVETRGAAHNQEFEVECSIPKLEVGVRGSGRSRRGAEQSAAKLALEQAQAAAQAQRRAKRKVGPAATEGGGLDDAAPPPGSAGAPAGGPAGAAAGKTPVAVEARAGKPAAPN
jgi:ribonuclease-3